MVQRLQSECRMHTVQRGLLRDFVQGEVASFFQVQKRLISIKFPSFKYALVGKINFATCAFFAPKESQRRVSSSQQKLWSSYA